jgi:hypothetical protein
MYYQRFSVSVTVTASLFMTAWLHGCGSATPPPAFAEKPRSTYQLNVDNESSTANGDEAQTNPPAEPVGAEGFDQILADDDSSTGSADATIDESPDSTDDETLTNSNDDISNNSPDTISTTNDTNSLNRQEQRLCARLQGVETDDVQLADQPANIQLTEESIYGFKILGNQSILDIQMIGLQDHKTQGICVFLAGNQPEAMIQIDQITVSRLIIIARGNQAKATINYLNGGSTDQQMIDMSGNRASVAITGANPLTCQETLLRRQGENTEFSCQ